MTGPQQGGRPSANEQQNSARIMLAIAGVLTVALVALITCGSLVVSGAWTLPGTAPAQTPDSSDDAPVEVTDTEAPATPSPSVPNNDARAADLALDPNRQTDWRFEPDHEHKTVYLTFDDGPSENTKRVLDVLDQYGVKATFFVTGHEPELRKYIKEAYEKGHTIGLHTMTHDYSQVYSSEAAYYDDLDQIGAVVKDLIGYVPYVVRLPGGASNTVSKKYCPGIMSAITQSLPQKGYQYYDWNISSGDASGTNVPVDSLVEASCQEGYSNPMILFHDSGTKNTTPEALPRIIEFYRDRGYSFAAIDRNALVVHHGVSN